MSLTPLDEHNTARRFMYNMNNDPRPNGVACPECGAELLDSSPNQTLTSYPPQKNVHCPHTRKCGYRGYRVA